jgi:hypothetical protein
MNSLMTMKLTTCLKHQTQITVVNPSLVQSINILDNSKPESEMQVEPSITISDVINHTVPANVEEPAFMRKARELGLQKYDVLDGRKKAMVVRDKELQMATNISNLYRVRPQQNAAIESPKVQNQREIVPSITPKAQLSYPIDDE